MMGKLRNAEIGNWKCHERTRVVVFSILRQIGIFFFQAVYIGFSSSLVRTLEQSFQCVIWSTTGVSHTSPPELFSKIATNRIRKV